MTLTTRTRSLCVLVIVFVTGNSADAHNLFVLVKHQTDAPDHIEVIFEHSPRPGKGGYYQPLLKRGKTWIKKPSAKKETSLKLNEVTRNGKKLLHAVTETARPRSIIHSCKWGIYNGRLDYFHGKYLDVSTIEEAKRLTNAPTFPLDFVPSFRSDGLKLRVVFKGKAIANRTVWMWSPSGKQMTRKTDSSGIIRLIDPQPGVWSFATTHTQANLTGKFEGNSYNGVMHGTSFSMRWPIK